MTKKLITKADIWKAPKRSYEYVEVEEWGGVLRLQTLTGKERDDFEDSLSTQRGSAKAKSNMKNVRARLIAMVAVDEAGELLFTNSREVEALGDGQVGPLQKVWNVAQAMNGFSDADLASLVVDFEPAPDEPSTSD